MKRANDPFKEPNHGWYRKKRFELVETRGGKCEQCGSVNDLEFAHLRPTGLNGQGRGYNERMLDILRNPDAYMLLCKLCHRALDEQPRRL